MSERDGWFDRLFALPPIPDDGPALPRDGVPYLPAPVDALIDFAELAQLQPEDLVVDVGSGTGRACLALHRLSHARVLGLEVQPHLVELHRATIARLALGDFLEVRCVDAWADREGLAHATAAFLYCPFSGERLEAWLSSHEPTLRARGLRLGFLDVPTAPRPWLRPLGARGGLEVFAAVR